MKGGKAIAAGSDGCVFDGTFAADGTFTKNADKVTKVFSPNRAAVATNEYERMQEVKAATKGVGVVVATDPLVTFASIPEEAWDNPQLKTFGACGTVSTSPGPFTGLVLPRISGDLINIGRARKLLPSESFEQLNAALEGMSKTRLVHMDFAARNVFYKEEGGTITTLLGDFGTTVNLEDPAFDAKIQGYVERYRLRNKFVGCTKVDGIDPIAVAMMIGYDTLLQGKTAYEAFLQEILLKQYFQRTNRMAELTWVVRYLQDRSANDGSLADDDDGSWTVIEFTDDLADEFKKVLSMFMPSQPSTYEEVLAKKDEIRDELKSRLAESDTKLFTILVGSYIMPVLDKSACTVIRNAWFPTAAPLPPAPAPGAASAANKPPVPLLPASKTGGRRRRIRGGANLLFETLEDAIAVPDPVLGGRRKTYRKKRGKRVKMSRRR